MATTLKPRKRNTFTRVGGSTYTCDCCARLTRHTGAQALGSKLCPDCWDLAGLENEISDGVATSADHADRIRALTASLAAKGGHLRNWAALLKELPALS
jgi:hypothetical protein